MSTNLDEQFHDNYYHMISHYLYIFNNNSNNELKESMM